MSTQLPRGNINRLFALAPTLTPVAVATVTTAEQTFTVTGLAVGDVVMCVQRPNNTPAGVGITNSRVSAANTLALTFVNPTAGSVTPGSGVYSIVVARPETPGALPTVMTP